MPFRALFHIHTRRSVDSLLSPARILAAARKHRVDVLIITDHETIAGSRDICQLAHGNPRFVPLAGEFKTEKGDIVGIFLQEEVHPGSADEVITQIHPARSRTIDEYLLKQVDLIEVHNARCSPADNQSAEELASRLQVPSLAGADAHCAGELPAALNLFSEDLPEKESDLRDHFLHAPRRMLTQRVSGVYRPYSQMIKAVKTRDPLLFLYQSKRLALTCIHELRRQAPR
jgi:predicted metal-dependent phosphoesterase TrpH